MVGACTPAAAPTARVETASSPPDSSRRAAAATIRRRGPSSSVTANDANSAWLAGRCFRCYRPDGSNVKEALVIVVTGGSGVLGRGVVERLLDHVPADGIAVSVRDVDAAADLAARGVRVRRGDFAEPTTLAAAFEGAEQVLVVSVNALGDEARDGHRAAIEAAVAAGARRVLYTSHQGARPDPLFAAAPD